MDDRELLAALRTQPEEGLWALTQKYGALITAVVRRILPNDEQDAEECAADVLVRIWHDSAKITLQNGTIRGFVIWAARSAASRACRACACRAASFSFICALFSRLLIPASPPPASIAHAAFFCRAECGFPPL